MAISAQWMHRSRPLLARWRRIAASGLGIFVRSTRTSPRRARLNLEALERREVPAGLTSFVTTEHMHLNVGYSAAGPTWSLAPYDSDNDVAYLNDDVALYVGTRDPRTEEAGFEFVGAGLGGTYYQLSANSNEELLSVAFTGLGVSPSLVDRYNPAGESKGRIAGSGRWLKVNLVDVKHTAPNGQPGNGRVSVWTGGDFSEPATVFMASVDDGVANPDSHGFDATDGISADDAVWAPAGGHLHFNWGFTQKGRYDITFRASGYFGDGGPANSATIEGVYQQSELFEVHFVVGSAGQLEFSVPTYSATEADATATIAVHRVNGSDGRLTATYATSDGTATADADYSAASDILTFEDGETTKSISVPILGDDLSEPNETVNLTLTEPGPFNLQYYLSNVEGGSLLGARTTAALTIADAASTNPAPTITTLSATPNATTGGQLVTFTAAVASPGNLGSVTFKDYGTAMTGATDVPLVNGAATFQTSILTAATHPITAAYSGAAGYAASTSNVLNFSVAPSPPLLLGVAVNGNLGGLAGPQRSRVVSLVAAFNQPVEFEPNALMLARHTNNVTLNGEPQFTGVGVLPDSLHFASTDNVTWVVTFVGKTEGGPDGLQSLQDGVYDFTIDASMVHPLGVPGVNMAANSTTTFHRLYGDTDTPAVNGGNYQAVVNPLDNLGLLTGFNNSAGFQPFLDFNGDGVINPLDYLEFLTRFNRKLTWSA